MVQTLFLGSVWCEFVIMLFNHNNLRIIIRSICRRSSTLAIGDPVIDWGYVCCKKNRNEIIENVKARGLAHDVSAIDHCLEEVEKYAPEPGQSKLLSEICGAEPVLLNNIKWLPNKIHPDVLQNTSNEPILLEEIGIKPEFSYYPATFDSLATRLNLIRTRYLGHMTGEKGYYLKKDLADLENALIRYTLEKLLQHGFTLISVPDMLSEQVFESCGMRTKSKHSQVYHVDSEWANNVCLSGTAEMGIAAFFANKVIDLQNLPQRLCAVSRCFREEASSTLKEKGIFRVHQFTKVEMFGITANEEGNESEHLLQEFVQIQKSLFQNLGLHFKVLEMPPCDLGLPAYHKIDIEAWMPGRNLYGEISSASNCTDYQSRRLHTKYTVPSGPSTRVKHCHTINGTACAVPRMLISIFENFQNLNGSITVPDVLQSFLGQKTICEKFSEIARCMKPSG